MVFYCNCHFSYCNDCRSMFDVLLLFVRPVDAPKKIHQCIKYLKDSEEGKVPNDPDKEGKETIENKKSPQINVMSDDFLENSCIKIH